MAKKIKVLLVDDHALVRRGFRLMLDDDAEIEVAAEASDGEETPRSMRDDPIAERPLRGIQETNVLDVTAGLTPEH